MDKPENPPAFPLHISGDEHTNPWTENGMAMRDYFAAQILTGLLSKNNFSSAKVAAEIAFDYADAMLAERSKK